MTRFIVSSRRPFGALIALAALLALSSGTAAAHVQLTFPNGGQGFTEGQVVPIQWQETIEHGGADFDLWYSTSGPDGPWIEIASDLMPSPGVDGSFSYEWVVPAEMSQASRVRVRQDNTGPDYEDVSDGDFSITKAQAATTITLEPMQDATLYEGDGGVANGSGAYLFSGATASGAERRALLAFDVAGAIPAGSLITSASLDIEVSRTISGDHELSLYRVLESWSEGGSDPSGQEGSGTNSMSGDTTWIHRSFPDSMWATAGGSFAAAASGSATLGGLGAYSFASTSQMVSDVQDWLASPSTNFGWAVVMPMPPNESAKRFNSRENSSAGTRPMLSITYEEGNVEAPAAAFDFSPENPMVGESVQFSDGSTGAPSSWMWSFGDGTGSTEQNPSHVYASAGDYLVTLTVSNDGGSDMAEATVSVMPEEGPELSELVFIPAAANAEGAEGSFFVTTVDVHNAGSSAATFAFLWLPRNSDNAEPQQSGSFSLEPGASRRFANLLADVFGVDGVAGAAAVISDSPDIEAMSRTFNQTADGSFGQSLPGVPADELIPAGERVRVLFLTENADFRSNLGLLNGVGEPIVVQWELFDADGESLSTGQRQLAAWGTTQLNQVLADFAPLEAAYADVWTDTTGGAFTCYGSVLDNSSSDPTTVLPR